MSYLQWYLVLCTDKMKHATPRNGFPDAAPFLFFLLKRAGHFMIVSDRSLAHPQFPHRDLFAIDVGR